MGPACFGFALVTQGFGFQAVEFLGGEGLVIAFWIAGEFLQSYVSVQG